MATRLGYTVSQGVYLPAAAGNGATVTIDSGSASLFAGAPQGASHRWLGTVGAGESFDVSGLGDEEVLSVQADG